MSAKIALLCLLAWRLNAVMVAGQDAFYTAASSGATTSSKLCPTFGPLYPGVNVTQANYPFPPITTAVNLSTTQYIPKLNVAQQVRYYLLPGICANGSCWRCLQSPQGTGKGAYSNASTVESCSSNGTYNKHDIKGNDIVWKILPSGNTAPNGWPLYDFYSVNNASHVWSTNFTKVFGNVMMSRILVGRRNSNAGIGRYTTNCTVQQCIIDPIVIYNPCNGQILIGGFGVNYIPHGAGTPVSPRQGVAMQPAGLYETIGIGLAGIWSLKNPADINEKDNKFPLSA